MFMFIDVGVELALETMEGDEERGPPTTLLVLIIMGVDVDPVVDCIALELTMFGLVIKGTLTAVPDDRFWEEDMSGLEVEEEDELLMMTEGEDEARVPFGREGVFGAEDDDE